MSNSQNKRKHNMNNKWLSNVHVHVAPASMLRECISGSDRATFDGALDVGNAKNCS
jgi:hypothetical protein